MTNQRKVTEDDLRMPEFKGARVEDYEFRADGRIVRKDRWETGIREIASILMGTSGREFEIDNLVRAVEFLMDSVLDTNAEREEISFLGKTPMEIEHLIAKIKPPIGGWREKTYYAVDVAFARNNPIHRKVFYTGYLTDSGAPNAYSKFFTLDDDRLWYSDAYFLHAVKGLDV